MEVPKMGDLTSSCFGKAIRSSVLALVLIFVLAADAGYTVQKSMNQCAGYCKGTSKFNYEPGTIYHYDYEVDVSSSIQGAVGPGDKPSQMMMRAKAVLAALDSPCDLTLTLKEVKLFDPDDPDNYDVGSQDFAAALEKNPLRFSLQHGRVEELCSLPGELPWVLNIKRGLLSGLQNSMDDLKVSQTVYETDIAGSCETSYTAFSDMWWEEELWGGGGRGRRVKGAIPMTTVRRTKDLSTCSERNTYFLSLQANPTGRSKARHMLRSTHECEQSVSEERGEDEDSEKKRRSSFFSDEEEEEGDEQEEFEPKASGGGVLVRSECRETHLFEPFSYRESGATTNVTTRLILRGKEPQPPPKGNDPSSGGGGKQSKGGLPLSGRTGGAVVPYTYSTLLYDHSTDSFVGSTPPSPDDGVGGGDEAAARGAEGAIESLERATVDGVSGEAPISFASLISALRRLSHSQLMALFKKAGQGRSRKFLLDAMPVVATAASMSAFRDLYRSGDVSEAEMDSWMGGLAFLKRPTLPMIAAVKPLLEGNPLSNSVLGVTALVHSYCRYGGGDKRSAAPSPPASFEGGGGGGGGGGNWTSSSSSSSSEEEQDGASAFSGGGRSSPQWGEGCREKAEVQAVVGRLEEMLGRHGCRYGRGHKEEKRAAQAYLALKGLGNAGVAPSAEAVQSLALCYKDPHNAYDLRLAAVDVLRRVPCDSGALLRAQLLDTYTNVSAGPKETEIRIAAYVATMHCPTLEVMRKIEDTLHREEVNQVGSFVWTHLNNLRTVPSSTSQTYSGALSEIIASKTLRKKFRSDVRRFSRHYRVSTGDAVEAKGASGDWEGAFGGDGGISALGAGADAEASVVISPESYIPRSASLNLTVRLFGAEVDLLDIGARAEGLEPLVESVFGPGGIFSDDVVSRKSRGKRDDPNTVSRIAEAFRSRNHERDRRVEPKGSGYVRIFGNELSYGRFRGLGEMLAAFASKVGSVDAATGSMRVMLRDPISQLAVALAQERVLDYSRSVAFLDAALMAPTSAGLPISLTVNGTASVAVSASGRIDLTGRSEGFFEAEGVLAPSAALVITGTMSVTAHDVARSGLRLEASLRTNTRAEGKLKYRKGKLIEATLASPREAGEEIVSVRSRLFALGLRKGEVRPLTGRQEGKEEAESCTPKPVSKALGCEVCARVWYPNATGDDTAPRFPLTGPALASVSLGRTDTFEKYEFQYEFKDEVREEERGEGKGPLTDEEYLEEMRLGGKRVRRYRRFLLQFDTPGSKVDRRMRAALAVEGGVGGASLVQASVATPWTRTLEVTAGLENTASARGVGLTATLGGEEVVTAQAELRSVLRRPGGAEDAVATPSGRYEPSVTVSVRGKTLLLLHGRVDYVHGAKYSGDMLLAGDLIKDPVSISGDLTSTGGRYDLSGSVKSALIEGTVQGNFKRTVGGHRKRGRTDSDGDAGKFVNAKTTFKYSVRGGELQTLDVSARYLRNAKGALAKDSAYLTVLSTQFPEYEIDATWDSSTSEGPYFEGRGRLTVGKDGPRWETRPLLVLRGMDHLAFRFFLACRAKKLLYDLSLKHQITDKALNQHALLRMGNNHEISAYLNASTRSQPTARYTLESEIKLPKSLRIGQNTGHGPGQRVLAFRASVDEVRRRNYELGGGMEWWWSSVRGAARASGTYVDKGNRTNSDRKLEGKVWVVHSNGGGTGEAVIDTTLREPSLDFALQVTQSDRRAKVTAQTQKPRKYKAEVTYAKTGHGEHAVEGWAELSMGKRYDGKAIVSDGEDTKSAYLELGLGRRMSLDTKLHLGEATNGLEVEIFWDKDANQRLSTGATVEFLSVSSRMRQRKHGEKVPEDAKHGLLGAAWLEYPGRNIRAHGVIGPNEVTADLSWAPDREIELALLTHRKESGADFNLTMITPFQGIERQSASAQYTWDGKRFHGKVNAKWKKDAENLAGELTMVLPSDGASPWESDADVDLRVVSTIQSIRDAHLAVAHRTSASPLGTDTTSRVHWDGAEVLFAKLAWTLKQDADSANLGGSAELRSTGHHIRSFAANFAFGREGDGEADATVALSWKRPFDVEKKTVDLGFALSGLKSGGGYLNISAPIGEYENASAVFRFLSGGETGGRSSLASELFLDGQRRAVASVEGFLAGAGTANVDGRLETPWFSLVELIARHDMRGSRGLRESLTVKYGGKNVAEGELEATLRSSKDFVVRVTGGVGGTVASAKVEHKLLPKNVRSAVEVTLGGETSSAVLEARDEEGVAPMGQYWKPRVLHGSLTIASPRLRSGRLRFAVDYMRTGRGNMETVVAAPGIGAHHVFMMRDILNWESRLEAYRGWEGHIKLPVVNFTLLTDFDSYTFQHLTHLYMRGLESPLSIAANAVWGGDGHPEDTAVMGDARLEFPWMNPIAIKVDIPNPQKRDDGRDMLQLNCLVTYGEDGNNMTIASRLEREPPFTSITSDVTMQDGQRMTFGLRHDLTSEKKTIQAFALMDDKERAEALLTFSIPSAIGIKADLSLLSPGSSEFTAISLDFDVVPVEKHFRLTTRTMRDGTIVENKIDLMSTLKLENSKYRLSAVMEAPSKTSLFADMDLTKPTKLAVVNISRNGEDFLVVSASARAVDNSLKVSFDLKSELEGMKEVSFVGSYDRTDNEHQVEATLERDSNKSHFNGKLKSVEEMTELQVVLELPLVGYEYLKADAVFAKTPVPHFILGFQNNVSFYKVKGSGQVGNGFFNASVNVETPLKEYENIAASASHSANALSGHMDLRLSVDVAGSETSVYGTLECPQYTSMKGSVTVVTPIEGLEKLELLLDYDASKRGKLDGKAQLTTPGGSSQVIISGAMDERTKHADGRILISSPYLPGNAGSFGLEADYDHGRKGEVRVNFGNRISIYTASVATIEDGVIATVTTPTEGYRRMSLALTKDLKDKTAFTLVATREQESYKVTGKIESGNKHSGGIALDVTTGIAGWEEMGVQASYDFPPGKEMKAAFEAKRNGGETMIAGRVTGRLASRAGRAAALARWNLGNKEPSEFSVDGIYDMDGTEKSLEVHVKTPFEGYEYMEGKARVERETGFAMLSSPQFSYQLKIKREADRSGSISLIKNGGNVFSAVASLDRGRESRLKVEMNSTVSGFEGEVDFDGKWNRQVGKSVAISASASGKIEGFGLEKASTAEVLVDTSRPEGGAVLKMVVSTPLVSVLEDFYVLADYNGRDEVTAKAKTIYEGWEDVALSAKWNADDLYTLLVSFRRDEEEVVSEMTLEKSPGLLRITSNVTTPYEGFEEMDSIWRFKYGVEEEQNWDGEVEIKMSLYGEIIYGVEGYVRTLEKAADTELIIYTPDMGYETIVTKFGYDFHGHTDEGRFFNANSEAEGRLLLTAAASLKDGILSVKTNAPIWSSEEIDAVVIYKNWHDSETRVRIGKSEGTLVVDIPSNNEGEVKFSSNLEGYEILEARWTLEEKVKQNVRLLAANIKMAGERDGNFVLRVTPDLKELETEVILKFPGGLKYSVIGMWEVVPESREVTARVDILWGELGKVLEAEVSAEAPQGAFGSKVKAVSTQWRDGKEVTLTVSLEYEKTGATGESVLSWGDTANETVTLRGNLELASLKAISKLDLITPFTKPLLVTLDYDFLQDSPKKVSASYLYGESSYALKGVVNRDDFDFQMMTPVQNYKTLNIKGSRIISRTYKEAALVYELGEGTKGEMKATISSESDGPYEISVFAVLDGTHTWSLRGKWSMKDIYTMSGDIDVKWGGGGHLSFELEWNVPEKARLHFHLSGWAAPVLVSWKYSTPDVKGQSRTLEIVLQSGVMEEQGIRFSAGISPEKSGKTSFEAELVTPGEKSVWAAKGTIARKNESEYSVHATLARDGDTLADVEGTLSSRLGYSSRIALKGGEAYFEAGYDLGEDQKEAKLLAVYGSSHRIEATAKGTLDANAARASLLVETNFSGMKKLSVEAELGGKNEEREAALRAEWDGGRIEVTGSGAFLESVGLVRSRFAIRTPWTPLQRIELEATADIQGPTYGINAAVSAAKDYSVSFVGTLDLELRQGDITVVISRIGSTIPARFHASAVIRPKDLVRIRVETPFLVTVDVSGRRLEDEYDVISDAEWGEGQKLTLKGKIRSQPEDYGFNGELEWNKRRLALDAFTKGGSYSTKNCSIEGGFTLTTPYQEFPHMNMLFSLVKEESKLLNARLNMKTPFEVLPTLDAAISWKTEGDGGIIGEVTATADERHVRVATIIRKNLQGLNKLQLDVNVPFLKNSSPLNFEVALDSRRPHWKDVAIDLKLVAANATYTTSLLYAIDNHAVNVSFILNSPKLNFKGGANGRYENNALRAMGHFDATNIEFGYRMDKVSKELVGNLSLTAPKLGIPNAALKIKVSYLKEINVYATYKYNVHAGSVDLILSGQGIVTNLHIPPILSSPASLKLLVSKLTRGYEIKGGFSHGQSNHTANLSIENFENIIVKGKILSTYLGERDIDMFLRKDRKIGKAKISNLVGANWDASQSSTFLVGFTWKEEEHSAKLDLKTVGRYSAAVELSSPWLPNGGVNASATYVNEIDTFKAEIKCETKKGINGISLEFNEIEGRKTIRGEALKNSNTLAEMDVSVLVGDGLLEGSARLLYYKSSHKAKVVLKAVPISMELKIDSDYLKKYSHKPLSVSTTIDIDATKATVYVITPFSFLETANVTTSAKFTNGGHLHIEIAASVGRTMNGKHVDKSAVVTLKVPYPVSANSQMKQYSFELVTAPSNNRFIVSFKYEMGKLSGMFDALLQLDLPHPNNKSSSYYEIRAYAKGSLEEPSAETSGLVVWSGQKYGEWEIEGGVNEEGVGMSGRATGKGEEAYVVFVEVGDARGKVAIGWPANQSITVEFQHEIESWTAFQVGADVKTPFENFNDVSVELKSVMMEEDGYAGSVKIRRQEKRVAIAAKGKYENFAPNIVIEGDVTIDVDDTRAGQVSGHVKFLCGGASLGMDLKTPWKVAKELHFLGGTSWSAKGGGTGPSVKLEVSHNGREFLAAAADISVGASSGGAFIRTFWSRPASLRYDADFVSITEMKGNFRACFGECVGINLTLNGTQEIQASLEIPSRVVGFDWAWVSNSEELHCSTRLKWDKRHSLGFNLRVLTSDATSAILEVDLPVRSFELIARSGVNSTDSVAHSDMKFYWDANRDRTKILTVGLAVARGEGGRKMDATMTIGHPSLRRDIVLRLTSTALRLPFAGRLELEYSPEKADLFVADTSFERVKIGRNNASRLALVVSMRHQSSGLDIKVGAEGAAGTDKAGGQLGAEYVDARGRQRTIVLSAKAHRTQRSLQLKADTNENSLAVTAALEDVGLRLETKVNRKPPLTLRLLFDRKMPSASFAADRGRRRYKVYLGSTEPVGIYGPIKSVTVSLTRRDVDDDAPTSAISIAPAVETVLSGTTVSLNTSRVLSSRFLWEQRGGLRTPDVPATLGAALGTMGGWIKDAYSDVSHAWAAVAGEVAAGFLGEGTTHKLKFWYASIEDEVEDLAHFSRKEVESLVEDFRCLEELLSQMYEANDFYIKDIDENIVYWLKQINVVSSGVLSALRDAATEAYEIFRKVASAVVSSASRLVGDAIEATGSAVSSALPDPAEAARKLGEAAGRVAAAARRVGDAARGAARRLAHWAEGVVEDARQWIEERRARARQAVWDWAAAEAERMRPIVLLIHSYVIRFKEIVEEVKGVADEMTISIAENLANVREIMELGEMVDYYTFKVRNMNWEEATASMKAYLKKTWNTLVEDFKNGLGEYRHLVMKKYEELVGHYDQFMQLPPVVEFTGTVKFIYRKAIWTWHYLELGDHIKRIVSDVVMDLIKALAELAGQITEASRDPNIANNRDGHSHRHAGESPIPRGNERSFVLEAGYFEYNVKLPFDWDSFDSVPHFRQMWERPKEAGEKTHRADEIPLGPNRPGSTAFTRIRSVLADALLDASSAAAITEATDGELSAAAAIAALALPPFPSSALFAGDSHLVTFDGRDYSFSAAGCSYLLAGDLAGGTFSVLANYDEKGKRRSVSVLLPPQAPHAHSRGSKSGATRPAQNEEASAERRIDVGVDGRVSVDGRRVELPIEVGSATVGREGERIVVEVGRPSSSGGSPQSAALDALRSAIPALVLDCNPFHNVCTVRISGWLFARTAGLLGTYDNEPSNDFETPEGETLPKGEEARFAEAWRVGNCTGDAGGAVGGARGLAGLLPSSPSPSPLPTASEPCAELFDRESDILSPLQPCFSRVDPAPYGRLCEVDVAAASNSPSGWETAACASAAAYVAQCRNAGMDLWVPQSCVRCYLSDGSVLSAGETKVYGGEGSAEGSTPAPLSGDVVFLVEQRPCLQSGVQISNLAIKLDNAMRTEGLRDNRFALVGFNGGYKSRAKEARGGAGGGSMVSRVFGGPHTHTVDGKIWSTKRHFEKAFHNMLFDGRDGHGPGGRTTPMEALWYAARLPFRDGVSKTVILVMCGDCSDATDAAYADAVGMLLEGDLTLHVLAPTTLRTKRQPEGPPAAVGFDSVGAFTTRNVRSLVPSRDLMRQLAIPKDLCSPLALETNGTRFDVGSVLVTSSGGSGRDSSAVGATPGPEELRRRRQRKFALDVFVRRVALTASPSRCQKCDCVADREGVGRVACQRCLFPSMERFFKEWDSISYDEEEDLEGQDEVLDSDKSIATWG